ncbi:hypothetical protein [Streptomyces sp. SID8016]|uniref:hypothetical protein n=1 Tax=Streptomyces sp. SID8016 TaxID=2706098 RepID=UPI0013DBEA8C|nr:hypothetical protein [Streptomyces sp. SID8016]
MRTVDGRQWANREDLTEHSGYSRATLSALWRDRETNSHPPARTIDGVMHWDLEEWTGWFAKHCERPRDLSKVDRKGDPDEMLPPSGQASVLGVDRARITQYKKKPPPGWPEPIHTEQLAKSVREYRTRRQLWQFADNPAGGFGTKGGRPGRSKRTKSEEAGPDPRIQLAAEALAALPGCKAGEVASVLAERHGSSVDTWKRIITEARKMQPDPRVQLAKDTLASMQGRTVAEVASVLAQRHGWAVKTWEQIIADIRRVQQR